MLKVQSLNIALVYFQRWRWYREALRKRTSFDVKRGMLRGFLQRSSRVQRSTLTVSIFLRTLGRYRSRSKVQTADMDDEFSMRRSVTTAWYGEESLDGEVQVGIMVSLAMAGS